MGYSKYVGRIGALAVALGIGTAVAQPAWAETPSNDTETSSKPAESGTPAGNEPAGRTGPNGPAPEANEPAGPALDDDDDDESNLEDEELENLDEGDEDLDPADKLTEEPSSGYTEQPPLTNTTPNPIAPSDPPEPNTPLRQDASSRTSEESTEENLGSEANLFAYQSNNEDTGAETDDIIALSLTGPSTLDFSTDAIPTVPSPAPIQNQPDNPIEIVIGTAGKLINIAAGAIGMLFSPIFTPGYNGPGGLALVFATLDMVRRELDRAFSNSSPTAVADLATTSELVPTTIAVLANDVDPNLGQGDILTVVGYTQASNGTVVLNSNGSFTYTPNAGFSGVDTFTYTISDDASPWHIHGLAGLFGRGGHASTAAVTITVGEAPVNVAPVARPDSATITQGSGPTTINVLGNDNDADNDPLTITDVTQPENGTVTFTTTGVSYAPDETFAGTDSFTYSVSDGTTTTVGTVTVTVTPVIVVNAPPTAVDDNVSTAEDTTINIDVTANDTDPEDDPLQLTAVSSAGNGTVAINGATVTYTPNPDWHGIDTFTYTISDGEHEDTATVTVVVIPVNESPVANDDSVSLPQGSGSTLIDVLANDTDADNAPTPLQVTGVTQPANGTVVPSSTGLSYTPNTGFSGTDTFTYTITDGTSFDSATVTVTVTPVNQAPALTISDVEVDDDGVVTGLITVTDPDGPTLTVTPPFVDEGIVEVTSLGAGVFTFTFTPDQEAHEIAWATPGDDTVTLTFTVSDGIATPVSASTAAPITPIEPTTDPGGEYGTVDLTDMQSLTGIAVTTSGVVYVIGSGNLDFDGDGNTDYSGYALGIVDVADQIFTPVALLGVSGLSYDVAVGPDGRLYVADIVVGVTAYDPSNGYAPTTITSEPTTQVLFANNRMYVTSFAGGQATPNAGYLTVYGSDYHPIGSPIALDGLSVGLAAGPTGLVYVTSFSLQSGPTAPTGGVLDVFDADGVPVASVNLTGILPYGVAVDAEGIAYVADPTGAVVAVDPFGPGIIGAVDANTGLIGIDIGSDGLLYVSSSYPASVDVLDPADITGVPPGGGTSTVTPVGAVTTFNAFGLRSVYGATVAADGRIVITGLDVSSTPILAAINLDGTVTKLSALIGLPVGLVTGPDGRFYVTDFSAGTITAFDPDDFSSEIIATIPGAIGLAFDPDCNLYVTSADNLNQSGSLSIIRSDGAATETISLPGGSYDVDVTPDGRVFVTYTQLNGGGLLIIETDGTREDVKLPSGIMPGGIAVGLDGTMFITDILGGRLVVRYQSGLIRAAKIDNQAYALAFDSDGRLLISNPSSNTISVLDPNYDSTNQAPSLEDPQSYSVDNEGKVDGQVFGADSEGDLLTYFAVTDIDPSTGVLSINSATGEWQFTPTTQARLDAWAAWNDPSVDDLSVTFSIVVTDGEFSDSISITIAVQPETSPQVQEPAFSIVSTDAVSGAVTGQVHVTDADGDQLRYELASDLDWDVSYVYVDYYTGAWDFTPTKYARDAAALTSGDDQFTFIIAVTDGSSTVPVTITVPVLPNTGPLASTPSFTITPTASSNGSVQGQIHVTDVQGDQLTYALSGDVDPAVGSVYVQSYTGNWVFTPTWAASNSAYDSPELDTVTFTVTVSDGQLSTTVTVVAPIVPNTPPQIGTPAFTITDTTSGVVQGRLNVLDVGGSLTYQLTTAPDPTIGYVYQSYWDGSWSFTPTGQARVDAGNTPGDDSVTFVITVSDGRHTVNVTVKAPIVPNLTAPQAETPEFTITRTEADGRVFGAVHVVDPDGDTVTYELTNAPDSAVGYVYYNYWNGDWEFTPTAQARIDAAGTSAEDTAKFVITASDGTRTTDITVVVPISPNIASPEAGTPPFEITRTENGHVYGIVRVTDADGDTLRFELTSGPDATLGTVSHSYYSGDWKFTPTLQARLDAAAGTGANSATFVITASDGARTVDIPITASIIAEHIPEAGVPPFTITGTDATTGAVTGGVAVTDTDNDVLVYYAGSGLDGAIGALDVNHYTGAWKFTPTAQARYNAWGNPTAATTTFSIRASDGWADTEITVTVDILPGLDSSILQQLAADGDVLVSENANGTIRSIHGTFVPVTITDNINAAELLAVLSPLFGDATTAVSSADIVVQRVPGQSEATTEIFYRLHPSIHGVPVMGSSITLVTNGTGQVTGVFSSIPDDMDQIDTVPTIDVATAVNAAKTALLAAISTAADPELIAQISAALQHDSILAIVDAGDYSAGSLTWIINLYAYLEQGEVDPDAADLDLPVIPTISSTYHVVANGPNAGAVDRPTDTQFFFATMGFQGYVFTAYLNGSQIKLVDNVRGIYTYRTTYRGASGSSDFSLPGQVATTGDSSWQISAVAAHSNISAAYDFFDEVLGRTSYGTDAAGNPRKIIISADFHPKNVEDIHLDANGNWGNAAWYPESEPDQFIIGNVGNLSAALDVMGHEYTHAVIGAIVNGSLDNTRSNYQSGALNEAYSDIFGSLIEARKDRADAAASWQTYTGEGRWLMGEDSGHSARDLTRHVDMASDYIDGLQEPDDAEHINSTIFSHAFYRMVVDPEEGSLPWRGFGRTSEISDDDWARVFYNSLYRLPSNATFVDARAAVISSAMAQNFTRPQIEAIQDAFDHVGIKAVSYRYGSYQTIDVGAAGNMSISDSGSRAFVLTNGYSVKVVDTRATPKPTVTTIELNQNASEVAVDASGNRAYVAGSQGVTIIDVANRVLADDDNSAVSTMTVPLPSTSGSWTSIGTNADGTRAFVTNSDGTLAIINYNNGNPAVSHHIVIGGSPGHLAVSADGSVAIVTNNAGGQVSVVNSSGEITRINVGSSTGSVAISDDGRRAVAYIRGGGVFVIDTATGAFEQAYGVYSYRAEGFLTISGDGKRAYITDHDAAVTIIDIDTVPGNWLIKRIQEVSLIDGKDDYNDYVHSVATTADGSRAFIVTHANVYIILPDGTFYTANGGGLDVNNNASEYQQVAVSVERNVVITTDIGGKLTVLNGRAF